MNTLDVILNHKSVRRFEEKAVSEETLKTLVKCAQAASTSSYYQAYTIIEVRSEEKRKFLEEASGGQKWVAKAPLVLMFCADLYRAKKFFGCTDEEVYSNAECYTVGVVDASLAAQNLMIAAESMGLGGVFVGGIRNDVEGISRVFELPELVAPMFAICLGYPAEDNGVKQRLPMEEILKVDCYDTSRQAEYVKKYDEDIKEYYISRTKGKVTDTWSERCGKTLSEKTRYNVGEFFKKIGLLLK